MQLQLTYSEADFLVGRYTEPAIFLTSEMPDGYVNDSPFIRAGEPQEQATVAGGPRARARLIMLRERLRGVKDGSAPLEINAAELWAIDAVITPYTRVPNQIPLVFELADKVWALVAMAYTPGPAPEPDPDVQESVTPTSPTPTNEGDDEPQPDDPEDWLPEGYVPGTAELTPEQRQTLEYMDRLIEGE